MPTKTQQIYKGPHYSAFTLEGGLIVESNRKQGGKHLVGPQAAEWIDAIENAIDRDEAYALCRALLQD